MKCSIPSHNNVRWPWSAWIAGWHLKILFTVGTLDPLIDDSLFMQLRWQAAGNPAELAIYPGGIHAFDAFPIELARKAHARIREFMIRMSND